MRSRPATAFSPCRLAGLDGKSSLLVAPQLQYCEGSSQWGVDVQDIMYKLSLYSPQFHDASLPPHAGITIGCDYAPPTNQSALFAAWAAADAAAGGGVLPALQYSHFHEWLDALNDGPIGIDNVPVVAGERPNIWIYECTPTHHWLFSSFRDAGRTLPAAEAFAAFYSLVARASTISWNSLLERSLQLC